MIISSLNLPDKYRGLTIDEVEARLENEGFNELSLISKTPFFQSVFNIILEPMFGL